MISKVSDVESKEHWANGTLSDIVLIDESTGICVEGRGITYLESFDEAGNELEEGDEGYLQDIYDDWLELAQVGEEGYRIV
jgi:hypothetical protein